MSFRGFRRGVIPSAVPANAPSLRAHAIAGMKAPATLDRSYVKFQPSLYGNDRLGTCAEAALAHVIRWQAALAGWDAAITDPQVIELYSEAAGYVPGEPSTDQGTDLVKLLGYQSQTGFVTTSDTYVGLWAALDHGNLNLLRVVMAEFGSAFVAVDLAEADAVGDIWRLNTPASYGNSKAGSLGAHAIQLRSYAGIEDGDIVTATTWGVSQSCTWAWVADRIYQAFAVYHPQMLGPTGLNSASLDRARLASDVASFASA